MASPLLYDQYGRVLVFVVVAVALAVVRLGASYRVATAAPHAEKSSAYECGFDPFDDARASFDVRFYLVAILFLLFDLEAVFLFPWAAVLSDLGGLGFWARVDFLGELTVGFVYAWKIGALEWQ